jgi:PQQ-dependent dehydrogenase (s-GDH family)
MKLRELLTATGLFFIATLHLSGAKAQQFIGSHGEKFNMRVVAANLSDPWKIVNGPDGKLWVSEAKGYRVNRIDPVTGEKTVLLDINNQREFPRYDKLGRQSGGKPWPQGGLMGLALHPQLLTGKPFVYIFYLYHFDGVNSEGNGCKVDNGGCFFKGRLVRYTYNAATQKLVNPNIICDSIPQSNDHNGGNIVIAPINGKDYLFYGIGDMGAGQFINGGRANHAQDYNSYEGKILRFNIEPDSDADQYDKWIPNDNPFNNKRQNAVWSIGHRNPEGIAYGLINGKPMIYSSEHGPFSDDEINLIEKGKNYGHPLIIGYPDDNYNGLAAGVSANGALPGKWHTAYPLIVSEKENLQRIGVANYRAPLISFWPTSNTVLTQLLNNIITGNGRPQWQAEAPSSIAVYTGNAIPGWKNSLLVPTLKTGKLIRLKLSEDGQKIVGDTANYFKSRQRYRDVAVSADGRKLYLAVDSSSVTSGPSKENPKQSTYPGSILEFTYVGNDNNGAMPPAKSGSHDAADKKKED